jgi:redox-sensitive bicupin YhaK (pirin superfamily)
LIQVFTADSRFSADHGWLKSNFSFSFADYYDPNNLSFGPLRVLNDDIVQADKGFGMHPHKDMEIVSIVLDGQLQHKDSYGHTATTTFGGIQRMSAGTGLMHSEMNPSETDPCSFLQIWFMPEEKGIEPSYEQTQFSIVDLKNTLLPIVSKHKKSEQVAYIHQDLTIYLSDLGTDETLDFSQAEGRRIFLFVLEGVLQVNGDTMLGKRDSARITDTANLKLQTQTGSRFMLIDLP